MVKLLAFDLDSTLAEIGTGILPENIEKLMSLERMGSNIAICSGKPVYYLCGLMRQVGLKQPILMGENGAAIQFGIELPPKKDYILSYPAKTDELIQKLKTDIEELCQHDLWLQPNQIGLTVFPKNDKQFAIIRDYLSNAAKEYSTSIAVYEHSDSFDVAPVEVNKGAGLKYLCRLLDLKVDDVIAIGDGPNDVPMFEVAGLSIKVGNNDEIKADVEFQSINEALDYILTLIS